MSREWKPGDVAIIPFSAGEERAMWLGDSWAVTGGRSQASGYAVRRPLVVIDPEDGDAVERLFDLFNANYVSSDGRDIREKFADALREFANPAPPKPDEPTAIWSVVEDSKGDQWVRALGPDFADAWVRAGDLPSNGTWTIYEAIEAVKVVQP